MSNRDDHSRKYAHLEQDIRHHADHLDKIEPKRLAADFDYASWNLLDIYLDYMGSHPENEQEREKAWQWLWNSNQGKFSLIWDSYRIIRNKTALFSLRNTVISRGDYEELKGYLYSIRDALPKLIA